MCNGKIISNILYRYISEVHTFKPFKGDLRPFAGIQIEFQSFLVVVYHHEKQMSVWPV